MSRDVHTMLDWFADYYMWAPVVVLVLMGAAGVACAIVWILDRSRGRK
jgi:hypothetical protein